MSDSLHGKPEAKQAHFFQSMYYIIIIIGVTLQFWCSAKGRSIVQRDSKRWTQFRMSIFPKIHMVRE